MQQAAVSSCKIVERKAFICHHYEDQPYEMHTYLFRKMLHERVRIISYRTYAQQFIRYPTELRRGPAAQVTAGHMTVKFNGEALVI